MCLLGLGPGITGIGGILAGTAGGSTVEAGTAIGIMMAGGGVGFAEIGAMTVGAAASFTVTAGIMKVFGAEDLTMRASATAAGSMVVKDSAVVADFMARAMVADTAGTDSYPRSGKLEDGWQQKCQPFSFLERISQKELSGEKLCDDAFVCGLWEVLKRPEGVRRGRVFLAVFEALAAPATVGMWPAIPAPCAESNKEFEVMQRPDSRCSCKESRN